MKRTFRLSLLGVVGLMSVLCGCSGKSESTGPEPAQPDADPGGVFESDTPSGAETTRATSDGGETTAADSGANNDASGIGAGESDNATGAARAIEEADIVKIVDNTLYALSQYGGLSTVDLANPDRLRLLDRHKVLATPFEMYVRDGIVYVLYQGYGEYTYSETDDTYAWVQTSKVIVVDATDPRDLEQLDDFEVPGYISDSRIVGDVLYVASYEDGYCWNCRENQPRTAVVSLDISEPADVRKVDELSFGERTDTYSWRRSISVNDQRMYLAGPEWGPDRPVGSLIQVVDISDPSGALVKGASVQVNGQINSRWQMDEYEGVLRVVSQPFDWSLSQPPKVETFEVISSSDLTPLGAVALELPRPEQLQSARFDGERGYAVTFERTDPLFTLDLSDPAAPKQVGELEMPGFLYHMEPRGNRLIGFGLDQGNDAGALHISVFDVTDLAKPVMLDRVNFGGDWGWPVEDQDRIHKALNILPDANLILMPYSGWLEDLDAEMGCYGAWVSGIQLIDWQDDALELRGTAKTISQARRGLLHDDRLLTIADERVEAFDISDRDEPEATSQVALAQHVQQVAGTEGKVIRIGQSWYSNVTQIDVTSLSNAGDPASGARLEIPHLQTRSCYGGSHLNRVFTSGDRAHLLYTSYEWNPNTDKENNSTRIATVNISDMDAPELEADATLDFVPAYGGYDHSLPYAGSEVVQIGSALVFNHAEYEYDYDRGTSTLLESGVNVVDLSDPADPAILFLELPGGAGTTALLTSGNVVARGRYEPVSGDAGRVRFYIDRVDVSDPQSPERLTAVNVPGSLLAFDNESGRAVTVDFRHEDTSGVTARQCYEQNARAQFIPPNGNDMYDWESTLGTCRVVIQSLNLLEIQGDRATLLDKLELDRTEAVGATSGDERLFVTLSQAYAGAVGNIGGVGLEPSEDCFDCGYYGWFNNGTSSVLTLGGLAGGEFDHGRIELDNGDYYYGNNLVAYGTRAVVASGFRGKLNVIDAADPSKPKIVEERDVSGYVSNLSLVDGVALAALGYDGVQTIPLD